MMIWITKYALTQGIWQVEAKDVEEGMCMCLIDGYATYFHGKDWHMTKEAAIERATEMWTAKIQSRRTQLAKLEAEAMDEFKIVVKS